MLCDCVLFIHFFLSLYERSKAGSELVDSGLLHCATFKNGKQETGVRKGSKNG